MKSAQRILVGLVTSLLLSAGFVSAAEKTETLISPPIAASRAVETAPGCGLPCSWLAA
jgi:hypothetical protein